MSARPADRSAPFLVIPAIDLIAGRCVRLREGDYSRATVYDTDPVEVARTFGSMGARLIHVVDLDAARGSGTNLETIGEICRASGVAVEVGGGIRSREAVLRTLDAGASRVVVGTSLVRDPESVARWAEAAPERLVAAIDARGGFVRLAGWTEDSGVSALDVARRAADIGCVAVEYTNIARDGTLSGPDVDGTTLLAERIAVDVILSGGVAETDDALRVSAISSIAGVIVGRAIYEGAFNLAAAIRRVEEHA